MVALITPMLDDGAVDYPSLQKLVDSTSKMVPTGLFLWEPRGKQRP